MWKQSISWNSYTKIRTSGIYNIIDIIQEDKYQKNKIIKRSLTLEKK